MPTGRTRTSTRSSASAKDASAADIKKAYRKLARANHPDSHPGDTAAEDRFKTIAEAYDVVGDAEKRKQYDELRAGVGGFGPFAGTGGAGGGSTTFDLNDLFGGGTGRTSSGGGGFSDLFGGMFGGGGGGRTTRTSSAPRRGADVETEATIGFADSIDGRHRLAAALLRRALPGLHRHRRPRRHAAAGLPGLRRGRHAGGVGRRRVHHERDLPDVPRPRAWSSTTRARPATAPGAGMSNRTISARIPAGVKDGQRIRLRGKGAAGEQRRAAGRPVRHRQGLAAPAVRPRAATT